MRAPQAARRHDAGMGLRSSLRALGADGPFVDPREPHGCPVEGWYWRIALPNDNRVVAVMGGVAIAEGERWGNVVIALHPESADREEVVLDGVHTSAARVTIGSTLKATPGRLSAGVEDVRVDCTLRPLGALRPDLWGALGPGHLIPGLAQHWSPIELALVERGTLAIGDTVVDLAGGRVYHERNWGSSFPQRGWWWGAAHAFADPECAVAFAGGALGPRPAPAPTALVVRTRRALHRLALPQVVHADVREGAWEIDARGVTTRVRVRADAADQGLLLSHPTGGPPGTVERRARQHLAGHLAVVLERRAIGRWRTDWQDESGLVGLEYGFPL